MPRVPDYDLLLASVIIIYDIKRNYPYTPNSDLTYNCPECGRCIPKNHALRHYKSGSCYSIWTLQQEGYLRYNDGKLDFSTSVKIILDMIDKPIVRFYKSVVKSIIQNKLKLKPNINKQQKILYKKRLNTCSLQGYLIRAVPIYNCSIDIDGIVESSNYKIIYPTTISEAHEFIQERIRYTQVPLMPSILSSETRRVNTKKITNGMEVYKSLLNTNFIYDTAHIGLLTE